MLQIFRIGLYIVYFWANENEPLEPVHVHVVKGIPTSNATKIWITKAGEEDLETVASNYTENHLRGH